MAGKAVVVLTSNQQPVINAEVSFIHNGGSCYVFPLTNPDGYTLASIPLDDQSGYIKVVAYNYKNYLQLVSLDDENQTMLIGGTQSHPNDIILPPLFF